jgi:G patch domain and KOW motifs-containing protein
VAAKEIIIPLPKQNSIVEKLAQLNDTKRKLSKIGTIKIPENETMDQRAAREIQEDLIKQDLEETEGGGDDKIVMPLKPDDLPLEGGTEPTLDDYGDMPVSNFGLAMLRGMGFKGELKKVGIDMEDAPMARPKGMGLGVDRAKLAQQNNSTATSKDTDEKLVLKKNAFAKVISGKHTGFYGVVSKNLFLL